MESSLVLDNSSKQLNVYFKKRFEHSSDVALKIHGLVNTVNAKAQIEGTLLKFFRLGPAPRFSEDDIYRPDQRLRLGIGAKSSSSTDDVFFTVTAKQKKRLAKSTDVVRGRLLINSYTQAQLKGHYDYNVRTEAWSGEAVATLSHALFRFSDDQDLKVSGGCRVPLSAAAGVGKIEPFLRLEENCWRVTTDFKGKWTMQYRL